MRGCSKPHAIVPATHFLIIKVYPSGARGARPALRWPEWYVYFYKATIHWWHWRSVILSNAFNPLKHYRSATVGDVLPNYEAQRGGAKVQLVVFRGKRALFFQQVCVCSSMLQLHRNGHDAQKVSYGRWASISGATNESRGPKLPVTGNPSGIRDRDSSPSTAAASGLFRGAKTWHSREKGPRSQTTVHLLAVDPCLTHGASWLSFWKNAKRSTFSASSPVPGWEVNSKIIVRHFIDVWLPHH